MDTDLSANAGDTGLISGLGRFCMPRATKACAQLLSPTVGPASCYSEATTLYCNFCVLQLQGQLLKPVYLEPLLCNKRNHRSVRPVHRHEEKSLITSREARVQ